MRGAVSGTLGGMVSSTPVDPRARITVLLTESYFDVAIQGAELFDLVDDHLTAALDTKLLYRFPQDIRGSHNILVPNVVGQEQINRLLEKLPAQEVRAAMDADDST